MLTISSPARSAVKYLVDPSGAAEQANVASGGFSAVASAVEAVVGLDEPPSEMNDA